jgi:hypothetical protein
MHRLPRFLLLVLALAPFCACEIAHHPASSPPATAFVRGQTAFRYQQYAQAAAWFEQAVHLEVDNADYHLWLGHAYGEQARRASASEQFFLACKVRRHLEQAVALDPEHLAARVALMEYYLQAPSLVGGSPEKAQQQAAEIAKRDAQQGMQAQRRCQEAEMQGPLPTITDAEQ